MRCEGCVVSGRDLVFFRTEAVVKTVQIRNYASV
jgi:hypothetical protein